MAIKFEWKCDECIALGLSVGRIVRLKDAWIAVTQRSFGGHDWFHTPDEARAAVERAVTEAVHAHIGPAFVTDEMAQLSGRVAELQAKNVVLEDTARTLSRRLSDAVFSGREAERQLSHGGDGSLAEAKDALMRSLERAETAERDVRQWRESFNRAQDDIAVLRAEKQAAEDRLTKVDSYLAAVRESEHRHMVRAEQAESDVAAVRAELAAMGQKVMDVDELNAANQRLGERVRKAEAIATVYAEAMKIIRKAVTDAGGVVLCGPVEPA